MNDGKVVVFSADPQRVVRHPRERGEPGAVPKNFSAAKFTDTGFPPARE